MALDIQPLHNVFVGEVRGIDLRKPLPEKTLADIEAAMDRYAVLVFHDQFFTDDEQIAFAESLGEVDTIVRTYMKRLSSKMSDISNLAADGTVRPIDDATRLYAVSNRLWHTDSSFREVEAKYSMLSAREIPPTGGETQFADMRAACRGLPAELRKEIEPLRVVHTSYQARRMLNFFEKFPEDDLPPRVHDLVRKAPNGEPSLFLASHASYIEGWPEADGRMLLLDLIEFATQPEFVYTHRWKVGDLVMWDNRCTMHRVRRADPRQRRDLRRTTIRATARQPKRALADA